MFISKNKIVLTIIYLIPFYLNIYVFSSNNNTKTEPHNTQIKKNLSEAYDFAETLVNKSHKDITLDDIKKIHRHIYNFDNYQFAGRFRDINYSKKPPIENPGANYLPYAEYTDIPHLMDEFIEWLHNTKEDPLKIAADAHMKFVYIHPFRDGNGRTARLLMNLILVQNGYPAAIIDSTHNTAARDDYLSALKEYDNNRPEIFYSFISKCIEKGNLPVKDDPEIQDMSEKSLATDNPHKLDDTSLMDISGNTDNKKINYQIIESNISDAYDFAETLVNKSHKEISLDDIKKIHWHIYKGLRYEIAGKFRFINYSKNPLRPEVKIIQAVDYKDIPRIMDEFIDWLHHVEGDAFKIAADAHLKLVDIHPFFDGNGRTARLLMNLILVQNGYPAAIIDSTHDTAARDEYLNSVAEFNNNRPENYYAYVSKCIKKGSLLATEDPKIYNITDQSIINSNMMNCILMPR